MIKKFEIKSHDGPGRIGKLDSELTPKIFFKKDLKIAPTEGSAYNIEEEIAKLFIEKINDTGLYSFINNEEEFFQEMEELQEETEQFEEISSGLIKSYTPEEIKLKEKEKFNYEPKISKSKKKIVRDTDIKLKATRMEYANYKCEINPNHITFTNNSGENQYLESHHLIPIKAQKDFPTINLDSLFNLVALCPICHMQVHHAKLDEKSDIFYKMYNLRKDEMEQHGFDKEKIDEIFEKYYLNKKDK